MDTSNKHGTYEFPHKLLNNLRLRFFETQKNLIELLFSVSPSPQMKHLSVLVKLYLKTEIELSPWDAISHENYSLSQILCE